MATARPIVSCRGSAHGLCHLNNAWISANGDLNHFAQGIIEIFLNPGLARSLGTAARQTVQEDFSWEQAVPRLEGAYDRVIVDA